MAFGCRGTAMAVTTLSLTLVCFSRPRDAVISRDVCVPLVSSETSPSYRHLANRKEDNVSLLRDCYANFIWINISSRWLNEPCGKSRSSGFMFHLPCYLFPPSLATRLSEIDHKVVDGHPDPPLTRWADHSSVSCNPESVKRIPSFPITLRAMICFFFWQKKELISHTHFPLKSTKK